MSSVYAVCFNQTILQIYDNKEDAEVLLDFLNTRLTKSSITTLGTSPRFLYEIKEVYTNCYINKIKKGYDLYRCIMAKDGTVIKAEISSKSALTPFGFRNKQITTLTSIGMVLTSDVERNVPIILYSDLAKDSDDIIKKCNDYRLTTLLDDVWNGFDTNGFPKPKQGGGLVKKI